MFTALIVQPIFNLIVLIYGLIPGHNFGVAIILFTILVRLLMWPLVKKQLHQTKAIRALQPEIKRIKAAAKGNRQQESLMMMELYKERKINPFASFGLILVQLPIFIGLYSGLKRLVDSPSAIYDFSYGFVRDLSWIKELGSDITKFDSTLFGVVDLTRSAIEKSGSIYWPAMIIVAASAVMQYYQSKQLLPNDKEARGLRRILKEASTGKQADQAEVNAAIGRSTRYLIPAMIFIVTVNIASALSLYWLASGAIAFWQQSRVLGKDEAEMEEIADKAVPGKKRTVIEGEVVSQPKAKSQKPKSKAKTNKSKKKASKKRRR
jgi:YidC/Oxa1 family membrane protein insertase